MTKGKITIVVGGQFGSEGKGAIAAQLARRMSTSEGLIIRTGGPNAGHSVVDNNGTLHKLRHLPTGVAVDPFGNFALAARSIVDLSVLQAELEAWPNTEIYLDPNATILSQDDINAEKDSDTMGAIGSTRKGIGAARSRRISRVAMTARMLDNNARHYSDRIMVLDVASIANRVLRNGGEVLIEAAQGYGLGLHTPFYPYCTSADCTAIDALADCRVNPWEFGITPEVWVVMRPYPIRVAGTSGPLRGETTWEALGLPEERTTVTNRIRRVGEWDPDLANEAVWANGGPDMVNIALTMVDHVCPELAGVTDWGKIASNPGAVKLFGAVLQATGVIPLIVGTGPDSVAISPAINDVREPV